MNTLFPKHLSESCSSNQSTKEKEVFSDSFISPWRSFKGIWSRRIDQGTQRDGLEETFEKVPCWNT